MNTGQLVIYVTYRINKTHLPSKQSSYIGIILNKIHREELKPDINLSTASERWIRHFAPKYDKLSPEFLHPPLSWQEYPREEASPTRAKSYGPAFKLSSLINYSKSLTTEGTGTALYSAMCQFNIAVLPTMFTQYIIKK